MRNMKQSKIICPSTELNLGITLKGGQSFSFLDGFLATTDTEEYSRVVFGLSDKMTRTCIIPRKVHR